MKLRLTDLGVKKLSLPTIGQLTYWDEKTPGFGLRCSAKSKSYVVMFGAKRRLKTLGRHPELSLADARKQARFFLASQVMSSQPGREHEFQAVVSEYLQDCRQRLRGNTLEGYILYLTKIKFDGPIGKVTQSQVLKAIEDYTKSHSSQNYAFTTFKVFFNWALAREYLNINPLAALKRPHRSVARDRVLSEEELKTLLNHTLEHRSRYNDIVSLLALTGQRRGEISNLLWSEIDGDVLILPSERTKNKRQHIVPLGRRALDLLHSIDGGSVHVFGTKDDDKPFSGWSRAHRRLIKVTEINHFTLHDLRRTFATTHAKIGTPIHITEKLLNHVSGSISGVAAVYNRHSYLEEMRSATDRYDEHLAALIPISSRAASTGSSRS